MKLSVPTPPTSSFVDGDRDYFLFQGIAFGQYGNGEPYVTAKGQTVELSNQLLHLPDGTSRKRAAADIAIKEAVVYTGKRGKTTVFCIAAPTAGLGQSGSFQRYIVLIEFDDRKRLRSKGGLSLTLAKR